MIHRLAYRVDDAAELVGFSRSTLYKDIRTGDLKTIHRGRSLRITHAALQAYLRKLQTRSAVATKPPRQHTSPAKAVRP